MSKDQKYNTGFYQTISFFEKLTGITLLHASGINSKELYDIIIEEVLLYINENNFNDNPMQQFSNIDNIIANPDIADLIEANYEEILEAIKHRVNSNKKDNIFKGNLDRISKTLDNISTLARGNVDEISNALIELSISCYKKQDLKNKDLQQLAKSQDSNKIGSIIQERKNKSEIAKNNVEQFFKILNSKHFAKHRNRYIFDTTKTFNSIDDLIVNPEINALLKNTDAKNALLNKLFEEVFFKLPNKPDIEANLAEIPKMLKCIYSLTNLDSAIESLAELGELNIKLQYPQNIQNDQDLKQIAEQSLKDRKSHIAKALFSHIKSKMESTSRINTIDDIINQDVGKNLIDMMPELQNEIMSSSDFPKGYFDHNKELVTEIIEQVCNSIVDVSLKSYNKRKLKKALDTLSEYDLLTQNSTLAKLRNTYIDSQNNIIHAQPLNKEFKLGEIIIEELGMLFRAYQAEKQGKTLLKLSNDGSLIEPDLPPFTMDDVIGNKELNQYVRMDGNLKRITDDINERIAYELNTLAFVKPMDLTAEFIENLKYLSYKTRDIPMENNMQEVKESLELLTGAVDDVKKNVSPPRQVTLEQFAILNDLAGIAKILPILQKNKFDLSSEKLQNLLEISPKCHTTVKDCELFKLYKQEIIKATLDPIIAFDDAEKSSTLRRKTVDITDSILNKAAPYRHSLHVNTDKDKKNSNIYASHLLHAGVSRSKLAPLNRFHIDMYKLDLSKLISAEGEKIMKELYGPYWLVHLQATYKLYENKIIGEGLITSNRFNRLYATQPGGSEYYEAKKASVVPFGHYQWQKEDFKKVCKNMTSTKASPYNKDKDSYMLCSEFTSRVLIATLVKVNNNIARDYRKKFKKKMPNGEIVEIPISKNEILPKLHPHRLYSLLQSKGVIEKISPKSTGFIKSRG